MRTPRQIAKAAFILRELAAAHRADAEQLANNENGIEAAIHQKAESERFDQFAELLDWVLGSDISEDSIFRGLLGARDGEEDADWPEPSDN